jgi:hypothetical protein
LAKRRLSKRHSTAPAEFGVGVLEAAGQDGAYSRHVDEHQGNAGQGVEDGRQLADVSLRGQIAISCQKATALLVKANRSWRIWGVRRCINLARVPLRPRKEISRGLSGKAVFSGHNSV